MNSLMNMVSNFFKNIGFMILLIFPMVLFHELGHYLVGKYFDLNPYVFSIGFGKELFSFYALETTWQISLIPLGGYVEFPPDAKLNHLPFFFVCIAGPAFSFLYSLILLYVISYLTQKKVAAYSSIYRGKKGIVYTFTPSSLFFTGIPSSVFVPENQSGWIRKVSSKSPPILIKKIPLFTGAWGFIKTLIIFAKTKKRPLWQTILFQYQDRNPLVKNFGVSGFIGPIGMVYYGKWAAKNSWSMFLKVSASFSTSLGILNLIPLSFLDGGQALMALFQINIGENGELSVGEVWYILTSLVLILSLLIFSFSKDILRFFKKQKGF